MKKILIIAAIIFALNLACTPTVNHGGLKQSSISYVDSTEVYYVCTECNDGTTYRGSYLNEDWAIEREGVFIDRCGGTK
jgi:hypothetical protein